jgi:hypothetical protein
MFAITTENYARLKFTILKWIYQRPRRVRVSVALAYVLVAIGALFS